MRKISLEEITSVKYGRLKIISEDFTRNSRFFKCECDCGNTSVVALSKLRNGTTVSCGCYIKEKIKAGLHTQKKHGLCEHPLYGVWAGMKNRCTNPNNQAYNNYGGRGISVCDEWIKSPVVFIDWGLRNGYKSGLEIDREDNESGYSPSNCRFVTGKTNMRNTRGNKLSETLATEIRLRYKNGETQTGIATIFGVSRSMISRIVNNHYWA